MPTADRQQLQINREIDKKYAVQGDPGRRIEGEEFLRLKAFYERK